jgi:hypothetical protein
MRQNFGYKILKTLPLAALENFKKHRRLQVFFYKGCTCVSCGKVGTHLALGEDKRGGKHLDLYDDEGNAFTIDHILPKSKGGPNTLDNLQPMCKTCNEDKGNGDKPFRPTNNTFLHKSLFIQKELAPGDVVYKKVSPSKLRLLGTVKSIEPNPYHPENKLGVSILELPKSIYFLQRLYVKK